MLNIIPESFWNEFFSHFKNILNLSFMFISQFLFPLICDFAFWIRTVFFKPLLYKKACQYFFIFLCLHFSNIFQNTFELYKITYCYFNKNVVIILLRHLVKLLDVRVLISCYFFYSFLLLQFSLNKSDISLDNYIF